MRVCLRLKEKSCHNKKNEKSKLTRQQRTNYIFDYNQICWIFDNRVCDYFIKLTSVWIYLAFVYLRNQPDFTMFIFSYISDKFCVESNPQTLPLYPKSPEISRKLYQLSGERLGHYKTSLFRGMGKFTPRGGIQSTYLQLRWAWSKWRGLAEQRLFQLTIFIQRRQPLNSYSIEDQRNQAKASRRLLKALLVIDSGLAKTTKYCLRLQMNRWHVIWKRFFEEYKYRKSPVPQARGKAF